MVKINLNKYINLLHSLQMQCLLLYSRLSGVRGGIQELNTDLKKQQKNIGSFEVTAHSPASPSVPLF